MNTSATQQPLDSLLQQAAPVAQEPAWLVEQRQHASKQFLRAGLPTRKQEDWRYTSFDAVQSESLVQATRPDSPLTEDSLDSLCGDNSIRLVIRDGFLDPAASQLDAEGIEISSLSTALSNYPERMQHWLGSTGVDKDAPFPALNTALMQDGAFIHVPAGCAIEQPVEIIYMVSNNEQPVTCSPRNLVVLEDNARLTLVEHYQGSTDETAHFTNAVTEISLANAAQLTHYQLQNIGHAAFHLNHVFFQQAPDSHYQALTINLGGKTARTEFHANFTAPGAQCELNGLYLAGDRQVTDIHSKLNHAVPGCHSEQHFKGILSGKGRAVFDGLIHVAPDAQQTAAHLKNDNLLLCRDAEIDTKPQLEIFADDVQCSHGTTVGQLDPEHLFYLRSRGIDKDQAYRMLCLGFAGEILDHCAIDSFRERVIAEISTRLQTADQTA